jgi:TRAP-type mannitol/chloroaromatic compound transport system substrate-binding protein
MTALSTLKLTATKKTNNVPQFIARRNKISIRIQEQIAMALAEKNGTAFAVTKLRSYVDKESGLRKQAQVNKRVKSWWFKSDNGKLALAVKYGARVLELSKGKFAVELASAAELVPTLEIIKSAVEQGELDDAIDLAANKLRIGFKK